MEFLSCVFGFFGGVLHVFMMYSCSKSFRELKNAIKKSIFPLFRGSGGQIKFLIEKQWGRIFVSTVWPKERYWVGLPFIHGCTQKVVGGIAGMSMLPCKTQPASHSTDLATPFTNEFLECPTLLERSEQFSTQSCRIYCNLKAPFQL